MDLLSVQEAKLHNTLQLIPPQHNQVSDQKSHQYQTPPKFLIADQLEALLQMQKTDPFCKRICKHLSTGKGPQHETDLFTHVRGLLIRHITNLGQRILALVIPESYGVYYAITKWNYYLRGADIIVRNDHKLLTKFLNGKNAYNRVNR